MAVTKHHSTSETVKQAILAGGDRIWRQSDFATLPPHAVSKTLSRFCQDGELRRLTKGVYYKSHITTFGESKPKQTELQNIIAEYHFVFPAGIAAANLLGFTTQNAAKPELATPSPSISKKLLSEGTVVHTRRPQAWKKLDEKDAALLDFLRNRAEQSELSPKETIKKLVKLLSEQNRLQRLIKVISTEPPRVRAMLGALCEQLNASTRIVNKLRKSLNPLSTFDFGILSILPNAKEWQAK